MTKRTRLISIYLQVHLLQDVVFGIEVRQTKLLLLWPQTPTDTPPPVPTTPLPDDYYEEAVPLDPGSAPQYFTTNMNSCVKTHVHFLSVAHRSIKKVIQMSLFHISSFQELCGG